MSAVINGSAGLTTNSGAVYNGIASGTAVASTSGTSIDFTSIPSWVKRITVMFNRVSTNGSSAVQIQIGSGSVTTSGYNGSTQAGTGASSMSTGFMLDNGNSSGSAAYIRNGSATITLLGSNAYCFNGCVGQSDSARVIWGGGVVSLSGVLDRVRITTFNGTDTFDAGSINILYE